MRALYLIRHGRPAFPGGVPCCLGRLDLPLSRHGWHVAERRDFPGFSHKKITQEVYVT